ncbi:MAG TPA: hypothetical protein VK543_07150 [Puia sp.]|nr:hypothetical protein [Puia sp.]
MRHIQPILEGHYYHIYNRGINGTDIFLEKKNYFYFLEKFEEYTSKVAYVRAYCLLKNHFHALVYVKENTMEKKLDFSKQLGCFFNAYAQAFNKQYGRKGSLFTSPFRRKLIESELYISSVIFYIHANAQHHGFVTDFREWPYSSYPQIIDGSSTLINSSWLFDWFGDKRMFIRFHENNKVLMEESQWVLEA